MCLSFSSAQGTGQAEVPLSGPGQEGLWSRARSPRPALRRGRGRDAAGCRVAARSCGRTRTRQGLQGGTSNCHLPDTFSVLLPFEGERTSNGSLNKASTGECSSTSQGLIHSSDSEQQLPGMPWSYKPWSYKPRSVHGQQWVSLIEDRPSSSTPTVPISHPLISSLSGLLWAFPEPPMPPWCRVQPGQQ